VVDCEWVDRDRHRRVPARLYFPRKGAGPFPVVVVSHDIGGGRGGFEYLGRYWANHGYVVVHLQHPGSDVAMFAPRPDQPKPDPAKVVQEIAKDRQMVLTRALDVYFAFDQVEGLQQSDPLLRGRLDLRRMAAAGHGVGAWTALAAAGLGTPGADGQVNALPDPRIHALLLLNLPGDRERPNLRFEQLEVPAMQFLALGGASARPGDAPAGSSGGAAVRSGGSAGPSGSAAAQSGGQAGLSGGAVPGAAARQVFERSAAADQYLVSLMRADGASFDGRAAGAKGGERDPIYRRAIEVGSTAFWDAYLRGDAAARSWLRDGGFARVLAGEGRLETRLK
jgi:hypothetical protein